MVGDIL